jgi:TRAP-type C4-dicarboxylate transport system permease small subunit
MDSGHDRRRDTAAGNREGEAVPMSSQAVSSAGRNRFLELYHQALRQVVMILAYAACASLLLMVVVTTIEVVLRIFRLTMVGSYDLVKMAATLTIAAALPYTTAIKGHVAIEYFFHKLGRRSRIVVDSLMRVSAMGLFTMLAWGCVGYGNSLRAKGEVSMTLQLPIYWLPYVLAASCVLVVLIKLYHLSHPGKSLLEP